MIKKLFQKYSDMIAYILFGALTTLVNMASYWLLAHPLGLPTVPSTVAAWVLAVLFAYVTNRKWVFHSNAADPRDILKEGVSFYLCRLGTGIVDWVSMYIMVDVLHWNDLMVKAAVNVIVIILNYVASKLIVFKKR